MFKSSQIMPQTRTIPSLFCWFLFLIGASAEDYREWKYSTIITINTSNLGLNEKVNNFPLLVQLNENNFNFSDAKPDGTDLRFAKADTTHLFYERERWDANQKLAEFWVYVDEILANNSTQFIRMFWGKPDAGDSSSGTAVFDTANDFSAVWHLNEDPGNGSQAIKDRTDNANDGTPYGSLGSHSLVPGAIGMGIDFSGGTDNINVGSHTSLDNLDPLTIETWIYPRSWGGRYYGRILEKTYQSTRLIFFLTNAISSSGSETFMVHRDRYFSPTIVIARDYSINLNEWAHVSMVINGSGLCKLYLNGVETAYFKQQLGSGPITNEASGDMLIGNSAPLTGGFHGIIDELRIAKTQRSPDWLKLSFTTQKKNQTVVEVKPLEKPVIATHPQSDTVIAGAMTSFKVGASGASPLQYQWQRFIGNTWTSISGAQDTVFTLIQVTFGDSGNYRAIVSNSYGADTSSSAYLSVIFSGISIITHPQSLTVPLGYAAEFTVAAMGTPPPTYKWMKNNTIIPNQTDSILRFNAVTLQDTGVYKAIASNFSGSDTSHEARLDIFDSSIVITTQPQNDTVLAGTEAVFTVEAGGIDLTYQWQEYISSFLDISGATSNTLKFLANNGHNGNHYRCIISSGPFTEISSSAQLIIASKPVIPIVLPTDTVLATGKNLIYRAQAVATPPAHFIWYFKPSGSSDSSIVSTNSELNLVQLNKVHNGLYFFIADNGFGKASSNYMQLHVVNPVHLELDLPQNYSVANHGKVILKPDVSGDGQMSYQWYENDLLLPHDTLTSFTIQSVDSTIHHGNRYFCRISNTYLSQPISTILTRVCTVNVQQYYNPFKLKAQLLSDYHSFKIRMKLWSDVDISTFPTSQINPSSPWADSIWVLYKSKGYAVEVSEAIGVARFATEAIKNAGDTLFDTLTLGPLPVDNDSCFWFSHSLIWHDPSIPLDTLLKPLIEANKLLMIDTILLQNPLTINGHYIMKTDTACLIIDGLQKLNLNRDSVVIVQCSPYPLYDPLNLDSALTIADLLVGGEDRDTLVFTKVGVLPIELDTLYTRWYIIGNNGSTGLVKQSSFTIGWPRPVYQGTLTAHSTDKGNELHLSWTAPLEQVDKIRIWWDTAVIPLDHTIPLPDFQIHDIQSLTLTIDTLTKLSNNTLYYLGLQVFKDGMWSRVTPKSSASAKTALGDTAKVPNLIALDSSWFDPGTNSMVINWHIDLPNIPGGKKVESGFSYTLSDHIDPNQKPIAWKACVANQNITQIPLGPSITFDTVYAVGLWLRPESGLPSPPTDSSTVKIPIPAFTWQEVTLFPNNQRIVYAANQKIVFKEMNHFLVADTVRSFAPASLPPGFVDVGGIHFDFATKNLQVPKFLLGLQYDSLPDSLDESDLGLYQYVNGQLQVMHGFIVDNGIIWDTVSATNLKYPFLVLADVVEPVITTKAYQDIVLPGDKPATQFMVKDNVPNVHWQFLYGPGHKGYEYGENGYFHDCNDTSITIIINANSTIINPYFGLRAIIVASDGVHIDTLNVSRRVLAEQSGILNVPKNKWTPIATSLHLEEKKLDKIFHQSGQFEKPWHYNIYENRLYRWCHPNPQNKNKWLEYGEGVKEFFQFQPGRIIWYKSKEERQINLGKGITSSLRSAYEITLKPKNWTDITLPFLFPIGLRDILESTGAENSKYIDVCHWQPFETTYEAIFLYNSHLDTITNAIDTLLAEPGLNAYTFYNHHDQPITLKIPPICLALSGFIDNQEKYQKKIEKNHHSWQARFNWRPKSKSEISFRQLRCGYKANSSNLTRYGPLPPSMSKIRVGWEGERGLLYSWIVKSTITREGLAFPLQFHNTGNKPKTIAYYLDDLDGLPENYQACMLNPENYAYEPCSGINNAANITVDAQSQKQRILVIGTQEFFDYMTVAVLPIKFINAYPNPFPGTLQLHYRLPLGIKEIRFALFNLKGQCVWQKRLAKNFQPGFHTYQFDEKASQEKKSVLTNGVYIMHFSAKNSEQKIVYGGKKRIICVK